MEEPDGCFAREIDIETGKILGRAEGEKVGGGAPARQDAMMSAATGLEGNGTDIGPSARRGTLETTSRQGETAPQTTWFRRDYDKRRIRK
ncbi:hypothetical protein VQ042_24565 [Aurantimonas sp. A2-1-M11]|uniref:hypothetical protein n=1 Tax=Aurantimonas sp. A2-1-M11 TaxID=3113712 RepID=UPI002F9401EE